MTKKRDRSEGERLRGRIRQLEKENRELKKHLGRTEKNTRLLQAWVTEDEEERREAAPRATGPVCPLCGCRIEIIDIVVKDMHRCESCDYRKTFPKK